MENIRPTLEEVKLYFEGAINLKSCFGKKITLDKIDYGHVPNTFMCLNKSCSDSDGATIWHEDKGYAKILTYKNNDMKITKEFIKANADKTLKEVFPEVCAPVLEVGKWYKFNLGLGYIIFNFQGKFSCNSDSGSYGFTSTGTWSKNIGLDVDGKFTEATNKEVFEALKNEAVRRGFVDGNYAVEPKNCFMHSETIRLLSGNIEMYQGSVNKLSMTGTSSLIYKEGVWATIIETITKAEAERQLNKKII
jgi:hypothetical protein